MYGEFSGKIFDTDLCAVVATYIHWCLPGLGLHLTITLSPSFGVDPLGCQSQYKIREAKRNKNQTIILRTQSYEPVSPITNHYSSIVTYWQIRHMGKLHLHWQMVKTRADAICTRPRSKEKIKWREEKKSKEQKEMSELLPYPLHPHFQTHISPTIFGIVYFEVYDCPSLCRW